MYQLQAVDKSEAGVPVCQIDGEHGTCGGTKLLHGKGVVGIVGQSDIVDAPDFGQGAQALRQCKGVFGLFCVAHLQRLQPEVLHIGHVRGHVGPEVEQQLRLDGVAKVGTGAVVDNEAADARGTAAQVLGARHDLDIHAQIAGTETGEGYHRGVGYQGDAVCMGYFGQGTEVGHLHLGIGDNFQEDAARPLVDCGTHFVYLGQIAKAGLYAEALQGLGKQGVGIAKQVARCHHVAPCGCHSHQGVADGCHAGVEGRHGGSAGQLGDFLFEVSHSGIGHAGIVRAVNTSTKGIGHDGRILKLVGRGVIDGHIQRTVSIRLLVGSVDGLCRFTHGVL